MSVALTYDGVEARASPWPHRLAFTAAVAMVLTFSQCWQLPLVGPDGDPSSSGLIRNLFFPAYGAAMVLLFSRPWSALRTAVRSPLIWLLIGLTFVSVIWSVDPETTQRRAIALTFTTLGALALASRFEWPELVEVFASAFAVVIVLSYFFGALIPSYGRMATLFPGAWRGVYQEKNALGDMMTMAFITLASAAVLNPKRRRLWIGFAVAAVGLILLSTSKTSLVTLTIGSACLAFVWLAKRGPAISVAATFVAVTGLMLLAITVIFASDVFFGLLGKDATFTGRTVIWDAVMRLIQRRPWTGYGYVAVWTDDSGAGPLAWIVKWAKFRPHHAHNSWFETWLGLGYPGLVLWGGVFLTTWMLGLYAVYRRAGGYFALPFLVFYSLTTMTESVAFIYNDIYWVIFATMAFRLAAPDRPPELEGGPEDELAFAAARP